MIPITTVIASGFTISADIDLRRRILVALAIPVIDSAQLAFQGALDQTSSTFQRVAEMRFPGSLDMRMQVGAGSLFVMYPKAVGAYTPPFVRLEVVGSAETNPRTVTLMTIPRGFEA